MTGQSLGMAHRAQVDRGLKKILAIGLCCSGLVHTAAIAGVNYLAANSIEDLEITAIERVELDPEPKPTPSVKPIVSKPTPAPKPKVVKPIVAKVPTPVPVKIPTPKVIATPPPVVKIVKSKVAIKPPSTPVEKVVAPTPKQVIKPAIPKATTPPPFPKQLFADPVPKAAPIKTPQSAPEPVNDVASPLTPTAPPKQVAFDPGVQNQPEPRDDDFAPSQPGSTSKLARTPERAVTGTNQTNLAAANKLPQNFVDTEPSQSNNAPSNDDFGTAPPGNTTRIGANRSNSNPSATNQTSLASNSGKSNNFGNNFGGGSNNNFPENNDEPIGGNPPGNSSRIARGSSGVKNASANNQTSLSGSGRQGRSSLGGSLNGAAAGAGSGGDEIVDIGSPGNIASGSRNESRIQCLRNCDIKYPENLEDAEVGKDKMLVKVTIDANGNVTSAQIARSSGNTKLDRVALDGVKQMQLTAMGKPLTFRAKISTLANN
jgi:TonB family protein